MVRAAAAVDEVVATAAEIVSSPASPQMTSLPEVPTRWSLPAVPAIVQSGLKTMSSTISIRFSGLPEALTYWKVARLKSPWPEMPMRWSILSFALTFTSTWETSVAPR